MSRAFLFDKAEINRFELILDEDQELIMKFRKNKTNLDYLKMIQRSHVDFLNKIIETGRFPFKDIASEKAYNAAILTALHSDTLLIDKIIPIIENATPKQVNKADLAYLLDKTRVLRNLPQLYGTQYKISKQGKVEFLPIENEQEVNLRRKDLDMESFEDYYTKVKLSNKNNVT